MPPLGREGADKCLPWVGRVQIKAPPGSRGRWVRFVSPAVYFSFPSPGGKLTSYFSPHLALPKLAPY